LGMQVYKCYRCRKIVPIEKALESSSPMCSCGFRVFMKVRPEQVKRVRAI
jgi:DNA-directed RNA polymerase subunit RPC12/RpoP